MLLDLQGRKIDENSFPFTECKFFSLVVIASTHIQAGAVDLSSSVPSSETEHEAVGQTSSHSPDGDRSLSAQNRPGNRAEYVAEMQSGDYFEKISDDVVVWKDAGGNIVGSVSVPLEGQRFGRLVVEGNTIRVESEMATVKSGCWESYVGAVTVGWGTTALVCAPLDAALPPAGVACTVGGILLTPLINFDNACG